MNHRNRNRNVRRIGWAALGVLMGLLVFAAGAFLGVPQGVPAGPNLVNPGIPMFVDMDPDAQGSEPAILAWRYGFMVGSGPYTFDPQGIMTRGQAAVILVRCALGADFEPDPIPVPDPDHPYAYWAVPWLAEATELGLMEPVAVVAGMYPMIRADMAAILTTCGPLVGFE